MLNVKFITNVRIENFIRISFMKDMSAIKSRYLIEAASSKHQTFSFNRLVMELVSGSIINPLTIISIY